MDICNQPIIEQEYEYSILEDTKNITNFDIGDNTKCVIETI